MTEISVNSGPEYPLKYGFATLEKWVFNDVHSQYFVFSVVCFMSHLDCESTHNNYMCSKKPQKRGVEPGKKKVRVQIWCC